MSTLITRRSILKGMFAMPAIVAIGNIMPISVIESWDLDRPKEDWVLVKMRNASGASWVRLDDFMQHGAKHVYDIKRQATINASLEIKNSWMDAIKQLHSIEKQHVVVERLPYEMKSYQSTKSGILMPTDKIV